MAVTRRFKNAEGEYETDFVNVIAWRGCGENCNKFLQKGKRAAVMGELHIRSYTDSNGVKRTAVEVIADEVEFLDYKQQDGPQTAPNEPQRPKKAKSVDELEPVEDDGDLPF